MPAIGHRRVGDAPEQHEAGEDHRCAGNDRWPPTELPALPREAAADGLPRSRGPGVPCRLQANALLCSRSRPSSTGSLRLCPTSICPRVRGRPGRHGTVDRARSREAALLEVRSSTARPSRQRLGAVTDRMIYARRRLASRASTGNSVAMPGLHTIGPRLRPNRRSGRSRGCKPTRRHRTGSPIRCLTQAARDVGCRHVARAGGKGEFTAVWSEVETGWRWLGG